MTANTRWRRSLGALLLPVLLLTACTAKSPQTPKPAIKPPVSTSTQTTYPLTVTDDAGRSVTLAAEPKRVVSVAPSNTEMLFALGKGDLLVGRSDFDDYPPEATKLPSIGGYVPPNYEAIMGAQPDLVLVIGGSVAERDKLANEYKLPVLVLDPKTLNDVYKDLALLGQVVNAQPAATKLVDQMKADVAAVVTKVAGKPKPTVFYEVWHDPLMTAGQETFINDLITLAGGVNIGADVKGWTNYSLEQVQAKDPDLYITSKEAVASVGQRSGFGGLKAIKAKKVFGMDDPNLGVRPGPRLILGLQWFAKTIHPELFPG
ncbi:MAG TPA: ABC transporter substrate-binding protein [Symbiobacteriaceae bacterium]|nr:ABC transporter substrate-binding protein [Symbiobacteriaceae bacterium]